MSQTISNDDDGESNENVPISDQWKGRIPRDSVYDSDGSELHDDIQIWVEWEEWNGNDLTLREFIRDHVFPDETMRSDEWRQVRKLLDINREMLDTGWLGYTYYPYELHERGMELELRLFKQLVRWDHRGEMRIDCPNCSGTLDDYGKPNYDPMQDRYECEDCGYSRNCPWIDIETLVGSDYL